VACFLPRLMPRERMLTIANQINFADLPAMKVPR
jgi:hypothetical protein